MISVLTVAGLVFAWYVVRTLTQWHRLRHIPGPFWAGFSKWWLWNRTRDGSMYLVSAEECIKHGSLVRVAPNEVITSDPDVLRTMLSVRSPYRRSNWYEAIRLDPDHDNVLSERNDERHTALRAKMSPGYSGKDNPRLEESLDNVIHKLVTLIETKYLSSEHDYKPMDFARKAQYLTLDIIGDVGFGQAFGFLDEDADVFSYIETTERTIPTIILVGAFPWLAKVVHSPLLKPFLPKDTDAYGLGKIMGLAKKVVGERFQPDAKPQNDMLGSFIRHGLSQKDAESETMVQILAGSDTTASATRATMLHIITNPPVLSKLLDELSRAKVADPITDAEARRLPYLQAVIKEGLRIHPPVTGLMYKDVPAGGDTVKGHFIPEGTKLGYCAFGLFLDPKIWGADANVFRPERWLEGSPEEIRRKEANLDLVFGHGRWQCLGKEIAKVELNKIFVQLLRNFEFTLVNPYKPWNSFNAGIFIVSDMWLRVTKREPKI